MKGDIPTNRGKKRTASLREQRERWGKGGFDNATCELFGCCSFSSVLKHELEKGSELHEIVPALVEGLLEVRLQVGERSSVSGRDDGVLLGVRACRNRRSQRAEKS